MGGIKQRGKIWTVAILMAAVVVFASVSFVRPRPKDDAHVAPITPVVTAAEENGEMLPSDGTNDGDGNYIHIGTSFEGMPNSFGAKVTTEGTSMDVSGVFVRRKTGQSLSPDTIYYCSVFPVMKDTNGNLIIIEEALAQEPVVIQNFMHASFVPVRRVNNEWQNMDNDPGGDFCIQVSDTRTAVIWYLRQTASLGDYGVRFKNTHGTTDVNDDEEYVYQVVHTGDWTFVSIDAPGETKVVRNFTGGRFTPLLLSMSYNEGAMVTSKLTEFDLPNGASVGNVLPELLVNTEMWNMNADDRNSMGDPTYNQGNIDNVTVSVLNGGRYNDLYIMIDGIQRNILDLRFNTPLEENKVYIIKFGSSLDPYIYGTLIIDNTVQGGVNLSTLWKFFVFFGAALGIVLAALYFIPVIVRRRNEVKVFRENERIQREKMGVKEVVGGSGGDGKKKKKGGLGQALHDFGAKWKGTYNAEQEKKKAEEEKLKLEAGITDEPQKRRDANGHSRFTDTIREKRERRQAAMQQGLTEEDLKRMEDSVNRLKQAKEDSFIHLREDTPIAKYKDKKVVNSADDITKNQTMSGGAIFTPIEGAPTEGALAPAAAPTAATPPPVPPDAAAAARDIVQSGGAVFEALSEGAPVEYVPEELPENPEEPQDPNGQ